MSILSTLFRSKEQLQFASRVQQHLERGGAPLLLEGAAGLGKTRAYLIPLLSAAKPVAICVPTRALATQMLESSDMAAAREGQSVVIFKPRREFETQKAYAAHKLDCLAADVLICTHQAAFIDVLSDGGLFDLASRHAIVFDEADQLPDAAALRMDHEISAYELSLLGIKPKAPIAAALKSIATKLAGSGHLLEEPAQVRAACSAIRYALEEPAWFPSVGYTDAGDLKLTHRLPARMMKHLLAHPRLAFISATLSINGSFTDFKRAIGLATESAFSTCIEPASHGTLVVISEDWDVSAPDHLQRVASHLFDLKGAVLVITTSHADAQALGKLLPSATVRKAGEETTGEAAARMEASGSNILIAAGAWAGLDTPTRWAHVVMPRAPYAAPTILDSHEVSRYVDSRNAAVRHFRQGLARGLRTPEAHCTLHLLDGRFARPEFIKAIPQRFAKAYQSKFGVVEYRTRQAEFRRKMIERFKGRCPVSQCSDLAALEAAHLGAKGGWRTNHDFGILLRSDLHRLMDAGKLSLVEGVVHISSLDPYYAQYQGVQVTLQ